MTNLGVFLCLLTLGFMTEATFLSPSRNNTNLAFISKIWTSASSSSGSPCVGRSSNPPTQANVILDNVCKTSLSPPIAAQEGNGYVTFNDNNIVNCSVPTHNESPTLTSYTLTFWVYNNCSSSSNECSFLINNTLVEFYGSLMYLNRKPVTVDVGFKNQWKFVALQRNSGIGTVFIDDKSYTRPDIPSSVSNIKIKTPKSLSSGEMFSMADVRLYRTLLTDREINQIYKGSSKLSEEFPHSECRCPESHPRIHKDISPYSLKCENPSGDVTDRFKANSVIEYVVDNSEATGWVSTLVNVELRIQLDAEYQIDEVEVKMSTISSCTTTIALDRGTNKVFNSGTVKWTNIANNIQKRSNLQKVVSRNVTVSIQGYCNQNNHQIKDVVIKGRCNCFGNANSCTYLTGEYTCQCSRNTEGFDCGQCQNSYYREAEEFGCEHICNCDSRGTKGSASTCPEVGGQCSCKTNVEGHTCDTCKHLSFNLQSSNTDGCNRSTCYDKGTIKCSDNSTCRQCECKPNVVGNNCHDCKQYHYGINTSTNGCVPCSCNTSGTVNRKETCNIDTGQCNCKTHVTGRECNQCKKEFYGFDAISTAGCRPCLCNKYGAVNNNCDMFTGQCNCVEEEKNRQCDPVIEDMSPNYGPKSGGTKVTINGQHLGSEGRGGSFKVFRDDSGTSLAYNLLSWNQTHIVFITGSSSNPLTTRFLLKWELPYYTDSTQDKQMYKTFQFKEDPKVTKFTPLTSFRSGGCDIRFEGQFLNSVAVPQLMSYLKESKRKVTQCKSHGSAVLLCKSPDLTNDTDTAFSYGLLLDGITNYQNLSQHTDAVVNVINNPTVNKKTYDDYKMLWSDTITIQGSRLKEGCPDNMRVSIGDVDCVIQHVDNKQIICKPDIKFPGINQPYKSVNVSIGNFWMSAGGLKFIMFWKTIEFLGIAIGAGVCVILVLVIVICCCIRRHRRKNFTSGSSKGKSAQNGFDLPTIGTDSKAILIEKEEIPRYTNRLYSNKKNLFDALSHDDTDASDDFLQKLESSVREKIKKSVSDRKLVQPDKVCTLKGTEIRIINGKFSNESPNAGKELTLKTNVRMLKELLVDGKYPSWINNGLLESIKFQDSFHDNILRIMGLTVDQNRFYILYPKTIRGLKEFLNDTSQDFDLKSLLEICMQVARGMSYMADENMVHKDLATRNCVVMPDNCIRISDASFSWNLYPNEYMYDSQKEKYLPVRWMALESLKMGFYDISSDVWSYGVLMWEVMSRSLYLPYHEEERDIVIKDHVEEGYQLGQPIDTPEELYTLMLNCWEVENKFRPTFKEVISRLNDIMNPESLYVNLDTSFAGKKKPAPPPPQRGSRRY